jgi:hypothetical protein
MRKIILMVFVMVFFGLSGTGFSEGMWYFFPKEDLNIYKERSSDSEVVGVFKRRPIVMRAITGKYPGWLELKYMNGSSMGWVERKGIIEYCYTYEEAEEKFARYKKTGSLYQPLEVEKPQVEEVIEPDTQPVVKLRETYDYKKKAKGGAIFIARFLLGTFLAAIYFLPSIIGRKKKNARAILALNILLGLFLLCACLAILFFLPSLIGGIAVFIVFGSIAVGWIIALVWASCKD